MLKKITTTIILCFLFGNVFSLCFVNSVEATEFKPQVTVGDFKSGVNTTVDGTTLGKYIREIYKYSLGFVGILACAVLMFGGFSWITAGGNGERIGNAKSWIGAALSGLVLMLCSYTLLYMVNPDLVSFKPLDVREPNDPYADSTGCCLVGQIATETKKKECTGSFRMDYIVNSTNNGCIADPTTTNKCLGGEIITHSTEEAAQFLTGCGGYCGRGGYLNMTIIESSAENSHSKCCKCIMGGYGSPCGTRNNCGENLFCINNKCYSSSTISP